MNFEYDNFKIPNCDFKISPSSIGNFFNAPVLWYKEHVTKESEGFTGSTSSHLGTIIHAILEAVGNKEDVNSEEIEDYIDAIADEAVDKEVIRDNYQMMAEEVVNTYLLSNMPDSTEKKTYREVLDGIFVGGTYDNITNGTLVDYKTAGKKPNTETIPFNYLIQLLAYAWALKGEGIEIDRVRIVYIVRATKTLPPRVFEVNHMISAEDWEMIENTLMLIADSVDACRKHPELTHLIFKSMKLKQTK